MYPYGDNLPIKKIFEKNLYGSIHHICHEVKDIYKTAKRLKKKNIRILGDGKPKNGAHNKPVLFLHPKDFYGTLIELEQE